MFKNEKKTKKSPLGGSKKLKSAAYSTAFAAIIIAAVVALNVIVSALGNAFPLSVDMSSGAENSLTEENIKFLKTVKKDVNIYVLSDEDDYKGAITVIMSTRLTALPIQRENILLKPSNCLSSITSTTAA